MHFQEIIRKKKNCEENSKSAICKNKKLKKTVFWKKINYFDLRIFFKKTRRPTKKCNNCRKLFGGGSENLMIKLVWPYHSLYFSTSQQLVGLKFLIFPTIPPLIQYNYSFRQYIHNINSHHYSFTLKTSQQVLGQLLSLCIVTFQIRFYVRFMFQY